MWTGLLGLVLAQDLTPEAALERFFTERPAKAEWFSDAFLAEVPLEQIEAIINDLLTTYGNYESVEAKGDKFEVRFSGATLLTSVALDVEGKFVGLFLEPPMPTVTDTDEALENFKALPGQTHVLVLENGEDITAHNTDTPLAVGSTFKLAILDVLQQQIADGRRAWDEVVKLDPEWKSLPSGIIQTWPDESNITLETLATLMISESDNTATDALLHIVGREEVEKLTSRNRPFLSTREAFTLKDPQNENLLGAYTSGDETAKRQLLSKLQRAPLNPTFVWNEPRALEVEWYFTPRELCDLMASVEELPLMSINSGITNADVWQRVSYKGGSEPGVLNMTVGLESKTGKDYCVSATWNNTQTLDEAEFIGLFNALVGSLQ
jgi:beta-lactamase class A